MSNILDYMNWRGDITFAKDKFNDIDALILSCVSYVNLDGIVPGIGGGSVSLQECAERFFEMHSKEELDEDKSFINFAPELLRRMAGTERFGDARLRNYVNKVDISTETQFAAVEIITDDGVPFVSFRGTDDTIVGWKEDFNLSYRTVPSEGEAIDYLEEVCSVHLENIRLGGHSKGGHLAIYAASGVSSEIASRIVRIYDNDGPGFNRDTYESEQFTSLKSRVDRIIPEGSIIGRLLINDINPVIVKSSETGIMQHNPVSWQLTGRKFETCDRCNSLSDLFDATMTGWIDGMELADRKFFIDDLFAIFEASGCIYLSLLSKTGIKGARLMLSRMNQMSAESSNKIKTLGRMFIANWGEMLSDKTVPKAEGKTESGTPDRPGRFKLFKRKDED